MGTQSNILAWEIWWTEDPGPATVHGVPKQSHDLAAKEQQYSLSQEIKSHKLSQRYQFALALFSLKHFFNEFEL